MDSKWDDGYIGPGVLGSLVEGIGALSWHWKVALALALAWVLRWTQLRIMEWLAERANR